MTGRWNNKMFLYTPSISLICLYHFSPHQWKVLVLASRHCTHMAAEGFIVNNTIPEIYTLAKVGLEPHILLSASQKTKIHVNVRLHFH